VREGKPGQLVLVGLRMPESEPEVERELASLPAESYRWYPEQSDVVSFLHASDVVVLPTTANESFGRVVIEALATGRPVIGSRVGGIPEILSGSMSRFLVSPGDADDLAERIESVLGWRDADPGLAATCHQWVADHFPYDQHIARVEDVLARHSKRGSRA